MKKTMGIFIIFFLSCSIAGHAANESLMDFPASAPEIAVSRDTAEHERGLPADTSTDFLHETKSLQPAEALQDTEEPARQMSVDHSFHSAMALLHQNISSAIPIDEEEIVSARLMRLSELNKEAALVMTASGEAVAMTGAQKGEMRAAMMEGEMNELINRAKWVLHTHPGEQRPSAADHQLAASAENPQYKITKNGTIWRFGGDSEEIISETDLAEDLELSRDGSSPSLEEIAANHRALNQYIRSSSRR